MSNPVIAVENLGKEYIIGGHEKGYETFREAVVSTLTVPFQRLQRLSGRAATEDRIWALKDVSFEAKEGDVVGIIGRNGAGKSTLLKILSRITAPTTGRVVIRGRVSSLLEVGTGFHPELTGRENIYLNGAILGMSRAEINNKFDEMVDFSGVEKFLDTPVKRYSSGMQVRLAFAIAAHLEPEILIVDEVLAVGDAEFQRKCLGKMQAVAGGGRTVLFVSHNMAAIRQLCRRGIVLQSGSVLRDADPEVAIETYYTGLLANYCDNNDLARARMPANKELPMQLIDVSIRDEADGILKCDIPHHAGIKVCIKYEVRRASPNAYVSFCFSDVTQGDVWWQYDKDTSDSGCRHVGTYVATIKVPSDFFRAGRYYFRAAIGELGQRAIDAPGTLFYITIGDMQSSLAARGVAWPSVVKNSQQWVTRRSDVS